MSELVLSVKDLSVRRESVEILRSVNFSVRLGEHWLILGPNGSGKTSLLLAITGYLMPTAGAVTVLGREFGRSDWRELRRSIGIVSSAIRQQIQPGETGIELVVSGKEAVLNSWRPIRASERRIALEWMRELGVEYLAKREWRCFSAGERQRLLIARALMAKPRVLILDEACAGLDPVSREHFLERLDHLTGLSETPAVLFVTHHIEEVREWMTHGLLVRSGGVVRTGAIKSILREGPLSEVFGEPVTLWHRNRRWRLDLG